MNVRRPTNEYHGLHHNGCPNKKLRSFVPLIGVLLPLQYPQTLGTPCSNKVKTNLRLSK